ncbi:hypothetical protein Acr_28g0003790 [Actinidia rufa]|uniref:Retrotransposon Copia-like N-terminal domain-containing protein n=1 Tax=Actinidia rufa TaxID=165716 RepID=A0A7J0HAB0_9ERIC|nr:hypothetical protein Acr_28g0003790 [Actinidia rufa]
MNLFNLNKNPKPDQGWLYFKAKLKKILLGGYPSDVKGWKKRFSSPREMVESSPKEDLGNSGLPQSQDHGESQEVAPTHMVPSLVLVSLSHSQSTQRITSVLLNGKNFHAWSRSFQLYPSGKSKTHWILGKEPKLAEVPTALHDDPIPPRPLPILEPHSSPPTPNGSLPPFASQDPSPRAQAPLPVSSPESGKYCNGLPRLFESKLERFGEVSSWVEEKGFFLVPNLLESKSFRRSFGLPEPMASGNVGEDLPVDGVPLPSGDSKSWLPSELRSDGTVFILSKSKNEGLVARSIPAKGVVMGEKCPREDPASSPNKKGKAIDSSMGKDVATAPEAKKKATRLSDVACSRATSSPKPGEGTLTNLSTVLGLGASILGSPSMAEKILRGVIPPVDKEKGEKFTLDQTATKLFQAQAREQQAIDELAKVKDEQDTMGDKLERSRVLVVELRGTVAQAKTFAMEEFKSSSNFLGAVEDAASKYFGEGFDFYKRQLHRHRPNLTIDLEGMGLDHNLLTEEDEAGEEEKKKEGRTRKMWGGIRVTPTPLPP